MAAAQIALEVEQGSTFVHEMQWLQADGVTAVDLTGCSIRSQWRTSIDSTETIMELTSDNGKIELDAAEGQITLHLTATETEALAVTSFVFDIEIVYPINQAGEVVVYRFAKGKGKVSREVTR